ncbi:MULTISPECIES: L,D-transpeptidase [unclassified Streptomyces]|uniref:L,D-transpeptidase n=1 Tax=unclassified Streptomyces TaxID=2593676 RepID=UPI0027417E54|nr:MULTISPECIES: L,D-transpeptidase [unclassified Streptomyces]
MPHDPSGPPAPETTSDRLTSALHEVAARGRRPAPASGAFVRRRALLRRRTRRAGLVTAGLVVAGAAVLSGMSLLGHTDRRAVPPATTAATTAPAPSPSSGPSGSSDGTVREIRIDLTALELHAAGRRFPVSAPGMNRPFRDDTSGRVTELDRRMRFNASPSGAVEQYEWVMRFLGPRQEPHFIYAVNDEADVPGRRPSTLGLIGLRPADARWLYKHTAVGTKVVISGAGT